METLGEKKPVLWKVSFMSKNIPDIQVYNTTLYRTFIFDTQQKHYNITKKLDLDLN